MRLVCVRNKLRISSSASAVFSYLPAQPAQMYAETQDLQTFEPQTPHQHPSPTTHHHHHHQTSTSSCSHRSSVGGYEQQLIGQLSEWPEPWPTSTRGASQKTLAGFCFSTPHSLQEQITLELVSARGANRALYVPERICISTFLMQDVG